MPMVKGMEVGGYIEVERAVRFKNAIQSNAASPFGKTYYVDYNATDGYPGLTPAGPMKHLQDALDACTKDDTILIRPYVLHADLVGGDPGFILPESTANWIIAHDRVNLALIGCGLGVGKAGNYATNLKGSTTVQATSTLDVRAPFVTLENLTFRRGGNTLAGVRFPFNDPGTTNSAFGGTVNNCTFWKIGSTATEGALDVESAWHTVISNCTFVSCYRGVYVAFGNSTTQGLVVKDCLFTGLTSEISADIYAIAGIANALIKGCHFNHAIPAGGSPNVYVYTGATSTGMVSDCYLGNASTTIATNMTLNGIVQSGCMTEEGEMVTD